MGLFMIAGLLLVAALIFWLLEENNYQNGWFLGRILSLGIGCIMLLSLCLAMGTNRSDDAITELENDYATYTLALEGCDTLNELNAIQDGINTYNDTIEEHRRGRQSAMANWLYSPKVAEMPLIVVPNYKLQEAE
jgi:hypothetical protein